MAILAIRGHEKRGKEVVEILEMLGGKQTWLRNANSSKHYYYINSANELDAISIGNSRLVYNFKTFTLEEFLEKYPYKVGDKVSSKYLKNYKIEEMKWTDITYRVVYKLQGMGWYSVDELKPYKEETMKEKDEKSANHVFDTEIISFDIAQRDKYELDLQGKFKVVLRKGVYYVERIKPQYPKTYEECCKVLGICPNGDIVYAGNWVYGGEYLEKHLERIRNFQKLLICRDAYWKIAGEEMGLGKPWEPDWKDFSTQKYSISVDKDEIITTYRVTGSRMLVFPTEKIRDAFYGDFKELIEQCKELL